MHEDQTPITTDQRPLTFVAHHGTHIIGEQTIEIYADKSVKISIQINDQYKDLVNPESFVLSYYPTPAYPLLPEKLRPRKELDNPCVVLGGVDA